MAKKVKFNFKKNWKKVLVVGLSAILAVGAIFGITRLSKIADETHKKISPTFTIGGLNESGKFEETEESIYTKTAFECQGLKITPDFDNTISYQVFFYDQNEKYLESTLEMTDFYQGAPLLAKYARIEITPNEDEKVSWYEVNKYAKQITVEVNKKQASSIVEKLSGYENKYIPIGEGTYDPSPDVGFFPTDSGFYFFDELNVSAATSLIMKVKNETLTNTQTYAGITFEFPVIYDLSSENPDMGIDTYSVIEVVGAYTYVCFDVSSRDLVTGFVDINSVDILEIFVV